MVPEASSPEAAHVAEELESPQPDAEPSQAVEPPAADYPLLKGPFALAAEDSFTADAQGGGQGLAPSTAPAENDFGNRSFGEEAGRTLGPAQPLVPRLELMLMIGQPVRYGSECPIAADSNLSSDYTKPGCSATALVCGSNAGGSAKTEHTD